MEIARRYLARHPTPLAAYLALQCALMRRYLARGGTEEEFCARLAPAFHRRYAPLLLDDGLREAFARAARAAARGDARASASGAHGRRAA
ncbi:hypothetical protein BH23GEM4_BH23GEM4_23580 [soil metagenome]